MRSIKTLMQELNEIADAGEIKSLEDFWREVNAYAEARERGNSFRARPVSKGLVRDMLKATRETERELERRLSQDDEGLQAIRELRAALERDLDAAS
jgi:hypothetical protein